MSKKSKRMRDIYEAVAERNGVTPETVEREMKKLIEQFWKETTDIPKLKAMQDRVPKKGDIPSPKELICYLAERIKYELD